MRNNRLLQKILGVVLVAALLCAGCTATPAPGVEPTVEQEPAVAAGTTARPTPLVTEKSDDWLERLQRQQLKEPLSLRLTSDRLVAYSESQADFATVPILGDLVADDVGEDEILVVFAVLDVSYLLLDGNESALAGCVQTRSLLECLGAGIWGSRKVEVNDYWLRTPSVLSMNSGDSRELDAILLPERPAEDWDSLSPPAVTRTGSGTLTATIPLRIIQAFMFELDDGPDAVVRQVRETMEDVLVASHVADPPQDKLTDSQQKMHDYLRKQKLDLFYQTLGYSWPIFFTPIVGPVLEGIVIGIVQSTVPEFVGVDTLTFTSLGYLASSSVRALADPEDAYTLACEYTPIRQYDSQILLWRYSGAGAHYVIRLELALPFAREPDPQDIAVSPEFLSYGLTGHAAQRLTIANKGPARLRVCSITPGARFSARLPDSPAACPNLHPELGPGTSCQVEVYRTGQVQFAAGESDYQSQLRIRSDDQDRRLVLVGLEVLNK